MTKATYGCGWRFRLILLNENDHIRVSLFVIIHLLITLSYAFFNCLLQR